MYIVLCDPLLVLRGSVYLPLFGFDYDRFLVWFKLLGVLLLRMSVNVSSVWRILQEYICKYILVYILNKD